MGGSAMTAAGRREAGPARPAATWQRVVLVGFMGSGKSTVGRLLARRLGWTFLDLDEEIEARACMSVEDLFRTRGEEAFRALERDAGAEALTRSATVLAPGGGWSLEPGRLQQLPAGTLTVWLKVSPETAVRRATGHGRVRPLLAGPDPVERARGLLGQREPVYARAALQLDTERASPGALVEAIVEHMERSA